MLFLAKQVLYLVGDRAGDRLHLLPTLVDGKPNPDGDRFDADRTGRNRSGGPRTRRRYYAPRRTEVIDLLEDRDILPAISVEVAWQKNSTPVAQDTCNSLL